jgi:hypothetical protein
MFAIIYLLGTFIADLLKSRRRLEIENLFLQFSSQQVKVGRSLSSDRRSKAKTVVKKGEGDRGDRPSD